MESTQRFQVPTKTVRARSVLAHHRVIHGPRALKQKQNAVMKQVRKGRERPIAGAVPALTSMLGEVLRQRAVWTEQTKEGHPQLTRLTRLGCLEAPQRGRCKRV
jgi:hypothetical protein